VKDKTDLLNKPSQRAEPLEDAALNLHITKDCTHTSTLVLSFFCKNPLVVVVTLEEHDDPGQGGKLNFSFGTGGVSEPSRQLMLHCLVSLGIILKILLRHFLSLSDLVVVVGPGRHHRGGYQDRHRGSRNR
jgi:hypothetical protein